LAILHGTTGDQYVPCRAVMGRSSLADVRLASRRASSEHASLNWSGGRWTLRDLGSSNGTTVNGRPLLTRDRATLTPGSRLCFGGEDEIWLLTDAAPPEPCGVLLGPQHYCWGSQSLLVLGKAGEEEEQPEASVFLEGGSWRLDDGVSIQSLECGEIVRLASGYWRLLLPDTGEGGAAYTAGCELDLSQLELKFQTDGGQLVGLILAQGASHVTLPARAYLSTLWELAKVRAASAQFGSAAGWVSAIDLATRLRCSPEKVNVDIHRLRKLFQESGVHQAANIIERDDAKRVRIGTDQIKLESRNTPVPGAGL
jgi:hypothetical protein